MKSLNKVMLIGNLGRDPEIRTTAAGKKVANFSLATSEYYQGEEQTAWHRIVAWGKLAEIVENYLHKGDKVYIEGKMTYREWEQEGKTIKVAEVVAFSMLMLGGEAKEIAVDGDLPF